MVLVPGRARWQVRSRCRPHRPASRQEVHQAGSRSQPAREQAAQQPASQQYPHEPAHLVQQLRLHGPAQQDVVQYAARQHPGALANVRHARPGPRQLRAHHQPAPRQLHLPHEGRQQRGLPCAHWAHQHSEQALGDGQGEVGQAGGLSLQQGGQRGGWAVSGESSERTRVGLSARQAARLALTQGNDSAG